MNPTPLELKDFSGGMTDNYVNAPTNRAEEMDNLIIIPTNPREGLSSLRSRPGSELDDTTNAQIPIGSERIGTLINYDNSTKMLVQSGKKFFYRNPSAYTTLVGSGGFDVFDLGSSTSNVAYCEFKKHLLVVNDAFAKPSKIYLESGTTYRVRTAGLPEMAEPTVTAGAAGTGAYTYHFLYYYEYTIGSEIHQDFGPTTLVQVLSCEAPNVAAVAITNIPVLSNGTTLHYDTANIKVKIYRTKSGGTTAYYIDEVTNGTTTYNDNDADSAIGDRDVVYTEGGVLDNDEPPLAKFVFACQKRAFYLHIKEGSEVLSSTGKISAENDIDSVPGGNLFEVEDEIEGGSSVSDIPIVGCKRHVYRLEGAYDEFGRGNVTPVRIHDTAGLVSHLSFVQAHSRLFWAGRNGFYTTDGNEVFCISEHLTPSYKLLLENTDDTRRIQGVFHELDNKIVWSVQSDSSSTDNDSTWVLDLNYPITKESTFTSASGGDSFAPSSLCYFDKQLYRGDRRGYVLKHHEDLTTDPKIDTTKVVAEWTTQAIIYNYLGPALSFGTTLARKFVGRITLTAKNEGNVSIQINAINDDGRLIRELKEIRWRDTFEWDDSEAWRRFPKVGLRVSYLQIQITNSFTVITNSDSLGSATVDTSAKTATLVNAADADWPDDSIDYYLTFSSDNYTNEYLVTGRTDDVLTFSDTSNTSQSGSQQWLLKGYRKGEVLNLMGYSLWYIIFSQSAKTYTTGDSGNNAT
jgi:hypothetical protein